LLLLLLGGGGGGGAEKVKEGGEGERKKKNPFPVGKGKCRVTQLFLLFSICSSTEMNPIREM
jgi:hypothetical protein